MRRSNFLFVSLAFVFLVAVAVAPALAQEEWKGTARLTGKVVDAQGKGVKNTFVKLRFGATGTGPEDIKPKGNGDFEAKNLAAGEWKIEAQAVNHLVARASVQLTAQGNAQPVLLTLVAFAEPPLPKELGQTYEQAEGLLKQGKFAEARAGYEQVLAARPDVVLVNRQIAFTYGSEGNNAAALKYLDIVLEKMPGDSDMLQAAVSAATDLGDLNRAMGYVSKLDFKQVTEPNLLINVSISMMNKQQPEDALKLLGAIMENFPQYPLGYFYRGLAKLRMQNIPEGKADLEKFVSSAPPELPQVKQAQDLLGKLK